MARFKTIYKREATAGIARLKPVPDLTEKDIAHLPDPVQKYLRYSGTLGKPQVQNLYAVISGRQKLQENRPWLTIHAQQYNFYDQPSRFFYITSRLFGIPFSGLHMYSGSAATFQIRLASLIPVVNAYGEIMTKGETVTLFNDMCALAPATLTDKSIQWETIDPLTVRATFTNQGHTISALLYFNQAGELINFVSDDRYQQVKGNTFANFRWSTPLRDYQEINGHKLASYGEAIWHMPKGEFVYAQYHFAQLAYNVKSFE
jgi:Family of unknown function (DUF6544)